MEIMDDIAARADELTSFGSPPRFDIRMVPLLEEEKPPGSVLIPASTPGLRDAVAIFAQQFRRETSYDFAPFDIHDLTAHGVLFDSIRFQATFPIAAGAAGLTQKDGTWVMEWVWIHPYERGGRLLDRAWDELEREHGQFHIAGP
jgi:hypothetical protein